MFSPCNIVAGTSKILTATSHEYTLHNLKSSLKAAQKQKTIGEANKKRMGAGAGWGGDRGTQRRKWTGSGVSLPVHVMSVKMKKGES